MSVVRLSLLLLLMVSPGAAGGAAGQPPGPLTPGAAVQEALARNPALIAEQAALEADRQRPAQEHFLPPPMLEAQIWQWPLTRINPAGATYMFEAQQMFPGRGKRGLRERLAAAEVESAAAAIPVSARDLAADVRRTYSELFVARKAVEIAEEMRALLGQIADATQIRYAAGRTVQQDVIKAVIEITRLHEDQLRAAEQARVAEIRLNTLLGRDPAAAIGPLVEPVESAPLPPLDVLLETALERQPELARARAETARAEAALDVVRGDRRPDYVLRGGYMLMPGEPGAFTAGVGITWNNAPWSRGRLDLAEEEARRRVAAARAAYDAAATRLRLEVHEAYTRLDAAAERAAVLRTSLVPQTTQALEVSRVGYQADRGALLEIIDNQRMLAAAQLGYYRALGELQAARADLDRAIGVTNPAGSQD